MRFVLAEIMHETNTLSPIPTPLEAFARGTGRARPALGTQAALARFEGTNTTLGGLIQVAHGPQRGCWRAPNPECGASPPAAGTVRSAMACQRLPGRWRLPDSPELRLEHAPVS